MEEHGTDMIIRSVKNQEKEKMKFIKHTSIEEWGFFYMFMEVNGKAFSRGYSYDDDNKTFYLDLLSVEKDSQKNGLGLEMQLIREKLASKLGFKNTMLWVKKDTWQYEYLFLG